jgi:Skp family chaperone for outer membrane proteins
MRKIIALTTVLLPMLTFVTAQQAPPLKIGFVNSYDVLYGTEEGKQVLDRLNKLMNDKQQQFDTQKAELDKLSADLEQKRMNLNVETRNEMERTVQEKQRGLTRFQEDAQAEITRQRDEYLEGISEKASKIIEDYAQKNEFGAVFLRDQQQAYVATALDITPEIIKAYNAAHPVAGAPAATSSTTPPTQPNR